jgi:hypothetical protein
MKIKKMLIDTVGVKLRYEKIIQKILENESKNLSLNVAQIIADTKTEPVEQNLTKTLVPVNLILTPR